MSGLENVSFAKFLSSFRSKVIKKLLLAGFLLAVLALPVSASHQFEPGISGFAKAKLPSRQSITVCDDTRQELPLGSAIWSWNRIAGWPLFMLACPGDVTYIISGSTWVQPYPTYREAYTSCTIYTGPNDYNDVPVLTHELGHCLGFSDHFFWYLLEDPRYNNPELYGELRICDNSAHPLYDGEYRGVMSYCSMYFWQWFRADDVQMLEKAGYRLNNSKFL